MVCRHLQRQDHDHLVAEHFFTWPGYIPKMVLADEQHLAAPVATLLMATVALTKSVFDEDEGVCRPGSRVLPIR
ncbi:hypothetical protein [Streptomyces mobaraensis]|uniref:Uncharacterized protein n=1 Tax=Streptomyces mobaraensis TaxID=35621 RepID=A0A5N5W5J0_STRMB|nr:hypothetical protein [Streptomyces mobaraensis]KAB7839501.1 hypothetical protein FRZ00_21430 [Streptomyces mobaraensis]